MFTRVIQKTFAGVPPSLVGRVARAGGIAAWPRYLAAAVEFDEHIAGRNIQAVRPGMEVFKLSAKTGEGMTDYLEFLVRRRANSHDTAAV